MLVHLVCTPWLSKTYADAVLPPSADPWGLGESERQVHWAVEAVNLVEIAFNVSLRYQFGFDDSRA